MATNKVAASAQPKPPKYETDKDDERKWKVEDALRALERAEEVRGDPSLMRDVESCRQDKMRKLASIKVEVGPKTMKMKK